MTNEEFKKAFLTSVWLAVDKAEERHYESVERSGELASPGYSWFKDQVLENLSRDNDIWELVSEDLFEGTEEANKAWEWIGWIVDDLTGESWLEDKTEEAAYEISDQAAYADDPYAYYGVKRSDF